MRDLDVVYVTAREEPHFEWFLGSLARQAPGVGVIVVDLLAEWPGRREGLLAAAAGRFERLRHVEPMPNVWQGAHRLTEVDVWGASTARNTGICLADGPWIAFVDDRSALLDGWLDGVQRAVNGRYAVAGAYRKVRELHVGPDGAVVAYVVLPDGEDHRVKKGIPPRPVRCGGAWTFGCNLALPLEWALLVNGFDETCNGLGLEDSLFGHMLEANRIPIRYDYGMMLVEDRTPGDIHGQPRRKDKGVSPNDKSHALVARLRNQRRATHDRDLRVIREAVRRGEPWPVPTGPATDWYDGTPLAEEVWP